MYKLRLFFTHAKTFDYFRNEAVINFILTTPSEPLLYKTMTTEENRHTSSYLAGVITNVIEEVESEKVMSLVTDNASAMLAAREEVVKTYPHISAYSCSPHTLNLLGGDIVGLKSFKDLNKNSREVVKEVTSSHTTKAVFVSIQEQRKLENKELQTVSLKLPGNTRWGSMIFCIESLLANKQSLKMLTITEGIILKSNVKQTILSDEFWSGLLCLHELLSPIVKWITILEGDKCPLSRVAEAFFEIEVAFNEALTDSPISIEEEEEIRRKLKKRRDMTLRPIHLAANVLDPKCNGKHITVQEQVEANQMIHKRSEYLYGGQTQITCQIFNDLADYRDKNGIFGQEYVLNTINSLDARTWWRVHFYNSKLSIIASQILSQPPSSAATERSFSKYGNVHTVKRNRLEKVRAGKLTYVSYSLNLAKRKKPRKQTRCKFSTPEMYNENHNTDGNSSDEPHDSDSSQDSDEYSDNESE